MNGYHSLFGSCLELELNKIQERQNEVLLAENSYAMNVSEIHQAYTLFRSCLSSNKHQIVVSQYELLMKNFI